MADTSKATDGPSTNSAEAWDFHTLPDWDNDFVNPDDILAFASALSVPETSPSEEDLLSVKKKPDTKFITALNDWRPVHQRVRGQQKRENAGTKMKRKKRQRRGKDETREGWTYSIVKYPFLLGVFGWIIVLGASYLLTRLYIYLYEQYVTWRGQRDRLRKNLLQQTNYEDWVKAAKKLDDYLGNDSWKEEDEYDYYDSRTIRRVMERMKKLRQNSEVEEGGLWNGIGRQRPVDELRGLVEACVKNNFAGFENPRLYSETYYGTKHLLQEYVDEVSTTLKFLLSSSQLTQEERYGLSKHLSTNFGRTALCLSGGATFAYYHFGIAKALLDAGLLPNIITGTSGGALVAALLGTRTDEELKQLLIPALAYRITACADPFTTWIVRWWRTGARFDSVDWAKRCAWMTHGSLTFLEAYQRTGRVLNVSCVPSDPHTPTILANYLTAPDCVIWSAVLASAAVPGILNPVVLMRKNRDGKLEPFSFGHKWKDGSLRTDIPLKSLNLHFNVNFSIVSQVNPHVNLFFFSSRGTVGQPVTHRRGRGWRGGFLGSAAEQYLKLDLNKWLKVLRHLELLPRPLGQDWSEVWLQRFSGTITIWPKSVPSDFWYILSDPTMSRLARMIHVGQLAAWPKVKFISNRMTIEKVIEEAREATRPSHHPLPTPIPDGRKLRSVLSEEDLQTLLEKARESNGPVEVPEEMLTPLTMQPQLQYPSYHERAESPSFSKRFSDWFGGLQRPGSPKANIETGQLSSSEIRREQNQDHRRGSIMTELKRQSGVFWDDPDAGEESSDETDEHLYETASEDEDRSGDEIPSFELSDVADDGYRTSVSRKLQTDGLAPGDPHRSLCLSAHAPSQQPRSMEERRAVLGCYLLSSVVSSFLQKSDPLRWTPFMDESLQTLREAKEAPFDETLVQQVRAQLLVEKTALTVWHDGAFSNAGHLKPPLSFYAQALHVDIDKIKNELPSTERNEVVLAQLYSAELIINETALSQAPVATTQVNLERIKCLYSCLQSIKAWFDVFFLIPPVDYVGFSFTMWSQLIRCLGALYNLSILDEPAWNRDDIRASADVLAYLDVIVNNLMQIPALMSVDDEEAFDGDVFTNAAKLYQSIRVRWAAKLGADNATTGASLDPAIATTSDILTGDLFDASWLDNGFFIDYNVLPAY